MLSSFSKIYKEQQTIKNNAPNEDLRIRNHCYFLHLRRVLHEKFPSILSFLLSNDARLTEIELGNVHVKADGTWFTIIPKSLHTQIKIDKDGKLHTIMEGVYLNSHLMPVYSYLDIICNIRDDVGLFMKIIDFYEQFRLKWFGAHRYLKFYKYLLVVWKTRLPKDLRILIWNEVLS